MSTKQFQSFCESILGNPSNSLPLTPGEYDLLIENSIYPEDSSANHFHFVAKLGGPIHLDVLQEAIWKLVDYHETLRTIFSFVDGIPKRRLVAAKNIHLQIEKCDTESNFQSLLQENFEKPFDLFQEVPCRFIVYQRSDKEFYLQIVVHHIATTLKGFARFPIDLAKIYKGESNNTEIVFPKAISDSFLEKYRQYLLSDAFKSDKKYWEQYLSGNLASPALPIHLVSNEKRIEKKVHYLDFDHDTLNKIKEISKSNNSTVFSSLTAAFQLLLARYTKQDEVIIGIPTDTIRNLEDRETSDCILGYTVNTLPLRGKINTGQTFSEFATGISYDIQNLSKHRLYPLSQIIDDQQMQRNGPSEKLFNILVVSQKTDQGQEFCLFGTRKEGLQVEVEGTRYESIGVGHLPTGRFDLALAIIETSQGLTLSLHYNSLIFAEVEIKRLMQNYLQLLLNVANNPHEKIERLSIVSNEERNLQLTAWNNSATESQNQESFLKCFEENVATSPDAIAVVFNDEEITYQDLNHKANKLARYLKKVGVNEETLIGIGVERSPELIISILAVLKAGCAYLPLDTEHPKERLSYILDNAAVEILITQHSLQKTFQGNLCSSILIDELWDKIDKEEPTNLGQNFIPDQLAYVLYTSGSTGKPKGVEITRGALDNFLASMQDQFSLVPDNRWLALTTISFDISNLEILLPLRQGATIVLADKNTIKDPYLLEEALEKREITHAQATPSLWQMLIDCGWKGNAKLTVLCGGEPLSQALARKLFNSSKALWNMYGPTETTIWSSMKKIASPNEKISIGRPIANTTFYILDENQQIQPLGVPGELHIGGVGLAKGYRGNLQLTQNRFIPSHFSGSQSSRLYKTGDLARYLPNGEVECLGRLDHQVKIRGHRIELVEIEESLRKCEGIQQVAVIVHEIKTGDKRIIAYCTGDYNEEQVIQSLSSMLPSYMLPSIYVHLTELPLTPNGKVDRSALPSPMQDLSYVDYIPPRNPLQAQIAKILESLLHIEKLSINSNFFSLGGHSLLAARAVSQINKFYNINLPIKTLLEKPTVSLIAKEVESALKKDRSLPSQKALKTNKSSLSSSQQRFWFLEQQSKNTAAYSVPFLLELTGTLDVSLLQRSIKAVIDRHEILRTVFREDLDGQEQLCLEGVDSTIQYKETNEKEALACIEKESKRPFDLHQGPLFRFHLFRVEKNRHLFFLNFHHIIFDAYSFGLFIAELKSIYEALSNGKASPLRDLDLQYFDYVHLQNEAQNKAFGNKQIDWWVKKLEEAPSFLNLPTDKTRPPIQTYHGALHEFPIVDQRNLKAIKSLCKKHGSTLFMFFLAAFHTFLYRYTGQNDLIIGIPVSGRNQADFDSLLGCFVNTLAMRTTSDSKATFTDLLKTIRDESFEAFKNQEVPFEKVVERLKIERSLSHSLLFQVMLNMLPKLEVTEIDKLKLRPKNVDRKMAHLDLSLTIEESEEGLTGIFEYNSDLFFKETIERMVQHFNQLLQSILSNPRQPIGKIPLLSSSEMHTQVVEWNQPQIVYPKESIVRLIEQCAMQKPDALAIVCKEERYSYGELNARANSIANTLLQEGLSVGEKVAVCLERSAHFIPTILGILKAGGVYVPIDPKAPKERIQTIIDELKPFRILTQSNLSDKFSGIESLLIDRITNPDSHNPLVPIDEEQLAYIIYTSGSTGNPKGVEIAHKSINDRVLWKAATYPLSHSDALLHTYSFIFDGAIINYFWPLCVGAKLIIATEDELLDPIAMIHLIDDQKVTTMDLLPSLLRAMLDEEEFSNCGSLNNVFSGGEALPGELISHFYRKCSARLHNTYGPTEATVEASVWECDQNFSGPIAPLGKPIAGAKLYILDHDQNIVPIGVPGELHIGGEGLARGYLNAPSMTSEKFIRHTLNGDGEDRLYRTGDLVKYRPDGTIEFLGRIDNQIKIRGFRVDLRGIETALNDLDIIEKALVLAKGQDLHKRLVAYVTLSASMDEKQVQLLINESLKDRLPNYMIPQRVVVLERFPTLLNGKINYKTLPEPILHTNLTSRKQGKNDIENDLLDIWKEVLDYEELTVTDNFFEVGGNSLLAMRLVAKIKNKMNVSVKLISVFQHPNIESFAKIIGNTNTKNSSPIILMREGEKDKKPFFCVHPVGGNVLCYRELAKSWHDDRPFYAIQAHGLEENEQPHNSIEKMASEYIKALQEVQPSGPYLLGGWSFGGLIAVEMANQLRSLGEEIAALILIDTTANIEKFKTINVEDESALLAELTHHYIGKPTVQNHKMSFKEQFLHFLENGGKASTRNEHMSMDKLIDLAKANYRALQAFSIPFIDTNVFLIRTEENLESTHHLGWEKYATNLDVFHAPGDHWAITQENHAPHYSKLLQNCLSTV